MDCIIFEQFSLNFSKFAYPSLKQNQKCTMDYSCKKLFDVIVLTGFGSSKGEKEGFLYSFGQKTAKVL